MNNSLRTILIVLAVLVVGVGVFLGGMFFASAYYGNGPFGMMGGYAPSMMRGYGGGMMGGYNGGMMGGYGRGMMGGYGGGGLGYGGLSESQPLSVEQARKALETYLGSLENADLAIKDIMIFDNGAYAAIEEKSTGNGAFELLVDPVTLAVYPEHGPNMMWNLKYGMMVAPGAGAGGDGSNRYGGGMMGGMMRGWSGGNQQAPQAATDMPVSSKEASKAAQAYLDANLPGVKVSDEVSPFYGYYTIDLERDGKIAGMLSVNGYSGEVWLHTWHGRFIEQSE